MDVRVVWPSHPERRFAAARIVVITALLALAGCAGVDTTRTASPHPATPGDSAPVAPTASASSGPTRTSGATPDLALPWAPVAAPDALNRPFVNLEVRDVTDYPGGFVAVGSDAAGGGVWTSPDGLRWVRRSEADGMFANAFINSIAWTGQELLAVGSVGDGFNTIAARAWSSQDGVTWAPIPLVAGDGTEATAVAAGAGGVVVLGTRSSTPVAWRPTATGPWDQTYLTWPTSSARLVDVAATGNGFVAVGFTYKGDVSTGLDITTAAAWGSSDGLAWQPLAVDGAVDGSALTSVAADGDGVVALGTTGSSTATWRSGAGASLAILQAGGLPAIRTFAFRDATAVGLGMAAPDAVRGTALSAYRVPSGTAEPPPTAPPSSIPCPRGEAPDLGTIMLVQPATRPACFGHRDLTFTATGHDCGGCGGTCGPGDPWLRCDLDLRVGVFLSPVAGIAGRVTALDAQFDPAVPLPEGFEGIRATFTGHFDDPISARCGTLVEQCREAFVITRIVRVAP